MVRFVICLMPFCIMVAQPQATPDGRTLLMRSGGSAVMADTVRLEGTESSDDPALFHDATVEREETLQLDKVPVPCYVVHATYDSMPGNPRAREISRTVWIAKDDYTRPELDSPPALCHAERFVWISSPAMSDGLK